jgi:hypothetical protein
MNSRILRAACGAAALTLALASPVFAQLDANLGGLTPDNVKGYLKPLPKALSATLNTAAFQSADIPLAGFNLTVGIHAMGVTFADKDNTYIPTDPPGFTHTGSQLLVPTAVGGTTAVLQPGSGGSALYYPGGFDISQFVIAVPQVAVGSVMGTRAVVRWIQFDAGDNELGHVALFGIGLQHSISRYVPIKPMPVDLSVGGMYQTFTLGNDKLIDTKAFHGEITASRKLGLWVQPYAGIGYDTFSMEVNYDQSLSGGGTQATNVKFDNENAFHGTLGVLVGFPMIKLHAQVDTAAETGVALGLRYGLGN